MLLPFSKIWFFMLTSFSLSLSDIRFFCWGVCKFLGSVLLQQKFEAMDPPALQPLDGPVLQLRVTVQFYLESKGKYTLEV